ncbi:hypothetical protein PV797_11065 [Clostridiaceae bacterium M8S5]|nr:hypothetical protein PV797_11065 [Clostridiaceae bacterium M8S5]
MKKIKLLLVIACLILSVGCTSQQNKNEKELIKRIKGLENEKEVMLNNITPFEWELVYSFDPYTSKKEVKETIGFEANVSETVNEGMPHLVFVKDKEVVCEIIGYPSNLGINIKTNSSVIHAKDNIKFKVEKLNNIVCLTEKTTDITEDKVWSAIENKEWSNYDDGSIGIGYGIYFLKEKDTKYAVIMGYGSGLAVIGAYKSEVELKDNLIRFDFPTKNGGEEGMKRMELIYKNEDLYLGDKKLEYDSENPAFHYNEWLKYTESKNTNETE